ncbi:hypothetical protein CEXT_405011 [Caerostris extrusa]|uniref:Uncharacterized protein n=1 Tax=Caerostris extrusa TaxID=172846 RepID=A0AAV4V7K9_CAEEX|nr:hypothetical protein CEXT_405011 [Caerostris extrusa]
MVHLVHRVFKVNGFRIIAIDARAPRCFKMHKENSAIARPLFLFGTKGSWKAIFTATVFIGGEVFSKRMGKTFRLVACQKVILELGGKEDIQVRIDRVKILKDSSCFNFSTLGVHAS